MYSKCYRVNNHKRQEYFTSMTLETAIAKAAGLIDRDRPRVVILDVQSGKSVGYVRLDSSGSPEFIQGVSSAKLSLTGE